MAASLARQIFRIGYKHTVAPSCSCLLSTPVPVRCFSVSQNLKDRFYTEKHEWVSIEGNKGTVGISDYAQQQLGDIVFVEFPEIGADLGASDVAGCLESVKAASEIFTPVAGKVVETNPAVEAEPALINSSPYEKGWLFKLELASGASTDGLMKEDAYKKLVSTLEES